MYIKNCRKI